MRIGERLREAIKASPYKITEVAETLGVPYSTLRRQMDDPEYPPRSQVIVEAAALLNVSPDWLLTGAGSRVRERSWPDVLEATGDDESKRAQAAWDDLHARLDPTVTEEQAFRSYLARWIKAENPETLDERLEMMEELAEMMNGPISRFGTELGDRARTDYRLSMLTALGLGMPPRE